MKYWKYYAIVVALISGGGWLYTQGGDDNDIEHRLFSNEEIKYETEKWMEEKPTALEEQKTRLLDSVEKATTIKNNLSAIKSRAKRDSIVIEEIKARKHTDSINLLNADQLYQIKEEFKVIKEQLIELNK